MNPTHTNRKSMKTHLNLVFVQIQMLSLQTLQIFLCYVLGVCAMSYQKMCDARTADGTDEDLILIFSD